MRNLLLVFCCSLLLLVRPAQAQELLAEVSVTTENVTIADQQIVQQLQAQIQSFLNTRPWTSITYRPEERIRFRLFIGITGIPQAGSYQATARIVTERPVYGTGYQSNLLSFADKGWAFNYAPQNPLDYSDNVFVSNLSSLLSFYAYIIIGMDQDSFSPLGGSPYYDRARNILTAAASQTQENDKGWRDSESRNRYWLLNDLQNPQLVAFRNGAYAYHRQGLDIFIEKPDEARASVFKALQAVQAAVIRRPNTLLARSFFETKADEIANIFRTASDAEQKTQVVALLTEIDPTNSAKYQAILKR